MAYNMITPGYNRTIDTIILVGRSGNGLTSCISSIGKVPNNDNVLHAVECSGVGDRGADRTRDMTTVINDVERIMKGYGNVKAIVYVMKYGVRYTAQEKNAVEDVKLMFGRNVFNDFGVIVMTHGDLFLQDDQNFQDWCNVQTGDIQKLFQEVNKRIVLFDNKAKSTGQFDHLVRSVSEINRYYTYDHFSKADSGRRLLLTRETTGPNTDISNRSQGTQWNQHQLNLHCNMTKCDKIIISVTLTLLVIIIIILGVVL